MNPSFFLIRKLYETAPAVAAGSSDFHGGHLEIGSSADPGEKPRYPGSCARAFPGRSLPGAASALGRNPAVISGYP